MRTALFSGLMAASALACMSPADDAGSVPAPAAPPSPIAEFEFPNLEGKRSFDCSTVPAEVRLEFLKTAIRAYIANRLNSAHSRYEKDETVIAWNAWTAANAADPLQSVVAKPTAEKPAEPNYGEVYDRAVADLVAGTVRRQGDTPKKRQTRDPLTSVVTEVVVRAVYDSGRAADPKYTYLKAKADVGTDGIAYLNAAIDAKVAEGADRAQLEKSRDERYINPAKNMLGLSVAKKNEGLPSIL